MAKSNSLKLAPYSNESVRPDGAAWSSRDEWPVKRVLQEYTNTYNHDAYTWEPNEPFEATLTLSHLERGRSAARFWWDSEDSRYPMFGQGLTDMLKAVVLDHGTVTGKWIVVKRGANYGIELA